MPTYEFRCARGHRFEKFSPRMSSRPSATCPKCGKRAQRLISGGTGLVFKGSGFYITDYKRKGEKKSDAEPKSESKSDSKSDSKSESKSTDSKTPKPKS